MFSIIFVMLVSLTTVVASDLNDTDNILEETSLDIQTATDTVVLEQTDDVEKIESGQKDNNTEILASSNEENALGDTPATFYSLNTQIRNHVGSELQLTQDAYGSGSSMAISRNNFVLDGQGHTLDARSYSRIFTISGNNVTLKNIVFKNGYYNSNGGAISITTGYIDVNIINCTFENNYISTKNGGSIYVYGNSIIVVDTENYK